jgi:hypothetical protein
MAGPIASAPVAPPPQAPAPQRDPAITAAYAKMRERATQGVQNQAQQAGEQLKRNFARMGGLNTGAFVKQQNLMQEKATEQVDQARAGVDLAEAQSQEQFAEAERGRQFAAGEAEKGRSFAGLEAEKGRSFQEKMTDKDLGFKRELFDFDKFSKMKQFDLADKEFARDTQTIEFNKRQAALQLGLNVEDIMLDDGPLQRRFRAAERQRAAPYMETGAKNSTMPVETPEQEFFRNWRGM